MHYKYSLKNNINGKLDNVNVVGDDWFVVHLLIGRRLVVNK